VRDVPVAAGRTLGSASSDDTEATREAAITNTDELLRNAASYAETFDGGQLPPRPAKQAVVLTCMDCRIDPNRLLGLSDGQAHVIRNAGGVVTDDAIRSLAISQRLLGTREILVIHHTGCGMLGFTDEEFAEQLEAETGVRPPWAAGSFTDLEEDVRSSVASLKGSPFLPHKEAIRGFVYDVETGRLIEIASS
jgi:carbonic anhydrase